MRTSEKRDQILAAADNLFVKQGFNGTGVDQIAQESGVTKRTLYRHFGSKDGLIRDVLEQHHKSMMDSIRADVFSYSKDPVKRLERCFELYRQWFGSATFSGCIFIKTLNELSGSSPELSRIAQDAKTARRVFIREIAALGGACEPEQLAERLQLLLEGAIVVAQCGRGAAVVDTAQAIADDLITQAFEDC
ncbi:MAG: TetR/AcrR family transcriptional regulator [Coraliomargarita sp.]|nr:TetR/AcrR family transcriptional regulator [Coraliomargarita sp.]